MAQDPEAVESQGTIRVRDISDVEAHVIVENDVGVVVRDGTRLSTKVFRPVEPGEYPVILALTAYGKDLGPDTYPAPTRYAELPDLDNGIIEVSPWTTWEGPDPATWVPKGYAVVYLDVRGYHQSEGDASVLSPQDADDFHDVIEWAGAQDWSNGNVGTIGVSYLAISQWAAAGLNPPSLKAMVPWEGQTDSFREVLYHGGVPETTFTEFWLNRVNGLANTPPLPDHELFRVFHRDPQAMAGIREQQFIRPELSEVPALVAATWSDQGLHTRGSFGGFVQTSATQKWLFTHGQPKWSTFYSDEAIEWQQAFFDHFLKGEDNGMDQRPMVRLEVRETRDTRHVRFESEWPLARTEYRPLYLDAASGALVETSPKTVSAVDYPPLTGSATFTTTFDEDTELTGHMKLRLWVSTTEGTDIDLFVGVKKLDVHGEEVHFHAKAGYLNGPVAMGWLRVSERALDESRSTPWQPVLRHDHPQPLTPGEIVPVDVEILPSSTLFRAGESLELGCRVPTSSNTPPSVTHIPVTSTRGPTRSTPAATTTRTSWSRKSLAPIRRPGRAQPDRRRFRPARPSTRGSLARRRRPEEACRPRRSGISSLPSTAASSATSSVLCRNVERSGEYWRQGVAPILLRTISCTE